MTVVRRSRGRRGRFGSDGDLIIYLGLTRRGRDGVIDGLGGCGNDAALVGRTAGVGFEVLFRLALVRELFQRIDALLDGADDVAVHAVAIVAGFGRIGHQVAVLVRLALENAAETVGRRSGEPSGRARDGYVGRVAVVADGAADAVRQDGRAAVDVKDALLHDAGLVAADAVADVARLGRIRRHLGAVLVELALNVAALLVAQVDDAGRRHHRGGRAGRCRDGHVHAHDGHRNWKKKGVVFQKQRNRFLFKLRHE